MRYLGGKANTAPAFAPMLRQALLRAGGRIYEPFTGGYNILPVIYGDVKKAHCSDIHPGVIRFWRAVQAKWLPPKMISRATYERLKEEEDWSDPTTTFAAFGCSYLGREWGGYLAGSRSPTEVTYVEQSWQGVFHKSRFMDNHKVTFAVHGYDEGPGAVQNVLSDHLVYCDPPARMNDSMGLPAFDYGKFWRWARRMAMYNIVMVSDSVVPSGSDNWLDVVWAKDKRTSNGRARTEFLLKLKS